MKILITGENSFIGNAFAEHVSHDPDINVSKISLKGGAWKSADLSGYDCVVHVAGIAHVPYTDAMDEKYMAVNRDLTLEFARAAKKAGIGHFIFLSSSIVYGQAAPGGKTRYITRDTAPAPENAYGLSKLEAENGLFAMAGEDFIAAAIRTPTVYGKGCRGAYSSLSKRASLFPIFPGCCGKRSVIYSENLAEFIKIIALEKRGGIFFPQDGKYAGTDDIVRAIRAARGKGTRITRIFDPFIAIIAKTGAARKIFGGMAYETNMSDIGRNYRLFTLEEGVKRTEEH